MEFQSGSSSDSNDETKKTKPKAYADVQDVKSRTYADGKESRSEDQDRRNGGDRAAKTHKDRDTYRRRERSGSREEGRANGRESNDLMAKLEKENKHWERCDLILYF